MNPFILIAARVLPDIIKAIAGDKVGTITGDVAKAVTDATGAKTAEEARDKLNADPAAFAALQLKLAQIAADQEDKRQQAQLELLKAQQEDEARKRDAQIAVLKAQQDADAKKREADLQAFRAEIEDRADARSSLRALAAVPGENKWIVSTAPILSYIVTGGFFAVLLILVLRGMPHPNGQSGQNSDTTAIQIINIVIGALTAAFATVVNFWLGSSQSSRNKDVAQERQAKQSAENLKESVDQTVQALAKSSKQNAEVLRTVISGRPGVEAAKPSTAIDRCVEVVLKYEKEESLRKLPFD